MDGGKTWPRGWRNRSLFLRNFGDVRTFWINPRDPKHMMLGSDGGLYSTWDGGKTTYHYYQIPLGEIYTVEVDNAEPYHIYAGLQDHESWKGPVNGWSGSVGLEDWVIVGMWDGMYTKVNPQNNRWLYFTTQFGKHHRVDQHSGERIPIEPKAAKGKPPYRYTWTTPLVISPHNGDILYTGGQMLLRSLNRGQAWEEISPDLTTNNAKKIAGQGHIMFCTITTISESPQQAGIIWVGTDDGRVHLTRNHGARWQEATENLAIAGAPEQTWVSLVAASNHDAATAYVCKTGFYEDLFKPLIYKTTDFGKTWQDISANLPAVPTSVVYEDRKNPRLLFVGTDIGVYFTLDGGKKWYPLKNNMPPVPVRDLLVHPREQDLVVGTYGRGVWVTNISPLQELNGKVLDQDFHLFSILPKPVLNVSQQRYWGNYQMTGDAHIRTPNERSGLQIFYYIKNPPRQPLTLVAKDADGRQVGNIKCKTSRGIHKFYWNAPKRIPGTYTFILSDGKKKIEQKGMLKPRLIWPVGNWHFML
jgi:photosystem II stability/assembly factor-like uncharacterized protein